MTTQAFEISITIGCVLIVAVTAWTFDLHELLIMEKRARRIKILKTYIQQFARKLSKLRETISGFLRIINPYIIKLLKWLLRLVVILFQFTIKILKWFIPELKETFQEIEDYKHSVNNSLLLLPEENLEMMEHLGTQLYNSPTLENVFTDHKIAVSYKISAAGKTLRYEETRPEEFDLVIIHRIKNFFESKRKVKAYVYIISATPTYLHFAVTYTPYGWERLMQIYPPLDNMEQQTPPPTLEEIIPEEDYNSGTGEKEGSHMKLGYFKAEYTQNRIKVPFCISLSKKTSNILVAGKSGSGKSLSARWYIWNMLHIGESLCYIADYKGGEEYRIFEGSPSYASGENAIKMINDFYELFTTVRNNKVRLQKHCTLFIEEWFGLLTYAETKSKSLKNELMAKIGEMLAVSRGLDMGLLICVQRADAALFSSGSREQFQCVISFGRCSAEQFRMLGFSGDLEENPTQSYKSGEALVLIDGQESVHEMIVPLITNPETLCRRIRSYLDRQPDICSLTRDAAGGGGTGQ